MKSAKKFPKKATIAVEPIFRKSAGLKGFKFATSLDNALSEGFNFLKYLQNTSRQQVLTWLGFGIIKIVNYLTNRILCYKSTLKKKNALLIGNHLRKVL